jgi:hypothetical protein
MAVPRRQTSEETVAAFLDAVKHRLWNRAYDCLTDSAQKVGAVELQKMDYLQKMMPDIRIDSLESFKHFLVKDWILF